MERVDFSMGASALRDEIEGEVITPDDVTYDEARRAWNLSVTQRPALIVIAATAADVVRAVQYAGRSGLGIAVQATGHGVVRPADDCLLLVTARMTEIRVDVAARTAWVAAGAKWGSVLVQTQAVGLAPLLGSSPDVGAVGYTLGGGMGWLARHYGLAADSVNYFEVVTADGRQLRASAAENNDLFWGLRGGGGSLAIVTGMEVRLFPVTTVYGGNLIYPAALAPEVFRRYRDWVAALPEEMTSSIVLMNYPPFPEVPEIVRGQSMVIVRGCFCGPAVLGAALLQEWRQWRAPLIDDFKEMSFATVATISNDPLDPVPGTSSGAWLYGLGDETIDTLIKHMAPAQGRSALTVAEVRHAGGAIARVAAESAAYGNREAPFVLQMIAITPTPEAHAQARQTMATIQEGLRPDLTGGVYLNFLEGTEAQARIADGYTAASFARLQALKARYDPENRLGFSFNIRPALAVGA